MRLGVVRPVLLEPEAVRAEWPLVVMLILLVLVLVELECKGVESRLGGEGG